MTYRGAVFFDYDGTITDEKAGVHLPTEKTLAAFEEALRKNGYLVVLATGRAIPYARHVLGYFDGVVTSNGTFSMVRQEVVADHPIEAPLLRGLVDALDGYGVFYGIDNPEVCYAKDKQAPCFAAWLHAFQIPAEAFVNLPSGPLPAGYKVSVVLKMPGSWRRCAHGSAGCLHLICTAGRSAGTSPAAAFIRAWACGILLHISMCRRRKPMRSATVQTTLGCCKQDAVRRCNAGACGGAAAACGFCNKIGRGRGDLRGAAAAWAVVMPAAGSGDDAAGFYRLQFLQVRGFCGKRNCCAWR